MLFSGTNLAMTRGDSEWLWVRITDREGNHVPFVAGDTVYFTVKDDSHTETIRFQKVITEFIEGKVYESLIDNNTWNPTDYPQGWEVE